MTKVLAFAAAAAAVASTKGGRSQAEPAFVQEIVDIMNDNELGPFTLKQITVGAEASDIALPGLPTVRKYIVAATADGRLTRVTRETYAHAGFTGAVEEVTGEEETDLGDELSEALDLG